MHGSVNDDALQPLGGWEAISGYATLHPLGRLRLCQLKLHDVEPPETKQHAAPPPHRSRRNSFLGRAAGIDDDGEASSSRRSSPAAHPLRREAIRRETQSSHAGTRPNPNRCRGGELRLGTECGETSDISLP